jgi:antitoxin (DNA-binding transcriptional repressor) of toxin-antitoxin stability system
VLDGVEHRHQTYVVTRSGRPIARLVPVPSANVVIAATALARNRIVVTADRGGFSGLPGVSVRLVPGSPGKD